MKPVFFALFLAMAFCISAVNAEENENIEIVKVEYGALSKWIDLTKDVAPQLEKIGYINVSNDIVGYDPYPNKQKTMRVIIKIDGRTSTIKMVEGGRLELPKSQKKIEGKSSNKQITNTGVKSNK